MITKQWTMAETQAVMNGKEPETEANWLAYAENFFKFGLQNERKNKDEMTRLLENLENSAKEGDDAAGAVLGFAVLSTFDRVQVVEDALSYLTRAMMRHVPGAATMLCNWYNERLLHCDLDSFDDADLGLDNCYDETNEYPRVNLPRTEEECAARLLKAAAICLQDFGMAEILYAVITVVYGYEGLMPEDLEAFEKILLARSKTHFESAMISYASARLMMNNRESSSRIAVQILEHGVEEHRIDALSMFGGLLVNGVEGVLACDVKRAVKCLEEAVEAGDGFAKYYLSQCLRDRDGEGVATDTARADALLHEAAEANVTGAMTDWGRNLIETAAGENRNNDIKRGCEMIRKAAEEFDFLPAWKAMLEFHDKKVGLFKTNKFARAAREAIKRYEAR